MAFCPDCGIDHATLSPEQHKAADTLSGAWVEFVNKMIEADIDPGAAFHFICGMMGKHIRPQPAKMKAEMLEYLVKTLAEHAGADAWIQSVPKEKN